MGIKGTVHRSWGGHFTHANTDLDVFITEEVRDACLFIGLSIAFTSIHAGQMNIARLCSMTEIRGST